jgi:hypothetical protein
LKTTVLDNLLTDGGEVVRLTLRSPLTLSVIGGFEPSAIVWLEGLIKVTNSLE